jgi:hypothetical protein
MNEETPKSVQIEGKDNFGNPRQKFADAIAALNETEFMKRAETIIWLAAYASNNPRSDYYWQASACYDEAKRRGKPELYTQAYESARASAS